MTDKPVVVYGASGYTGRLVCEYLREYQRAVHRRRPRQGRLQEVDRHDPRHRDRRLRGRRGRAHDVEALTELFDGRRGRAATPSARSSSTGPRWSRPCLAAGCHYLDTTGEQDWLIAARGALGRRVRRRRPAARRPASRRCTRPARSPPNICLETARAATRSTSWCCGRACPTIASTQTIFTHPQGRLVLPGAEPVRGSGTPRHGRSTSSSPASTRSALALPWGGTSPPGVVQGRPAGGQRARRSAGSSTGR